MKYFAGSSFLLGWEIPRCLKTPESYKVLLFLFSSQKKIMLNMFLDTMMADPPPQCLVWLPLMHRLAHVENGEHHPTLLPSGCREEIAAFLSIIMKNCH